MKDRCHVKAVIEGAKCGGKYVEYLGPGGR